MKTKVLRYNYYHNEISLSLENGENLILEATEGDIQALENNKKPIYFNENETGDGGYSCGIDGE